MRLRKECEHGRWEEHVTARDNYNDPTQVTAMCLGGEFLPEGALVALVNEQAEDEGLWFIARTAPEAYLQQELRRLHAAVESALASQVGESER